VQKQQLYSVLDELQIIEWGKTTVLDELQIIEWGKTTAVIHDSL